jgi:transposase InsO family protein
MHDTIQSPNRTTWLKASPNIQTGLRSPMPPACCASSALGFEHYNSVHPHKAPGSRSPREFRKQLAKKATENAVGGVVNMTV